MSLKRENPDDLSLVLGGPLYHSYLSCRLAAHPIGLVQRRVIALVLITWLPLAVLTIMDGRAFGGVSVPFFEHVGAYTRFLLFLPLLLMAEVTVHDHIIWAVRQFTEYGVVASENQQRFRDAITSALRLRDSAIVEIILLILSITIGHWFWKEHVALRADTWYSPKAGEGLTPAGYWYVFFCMPLLRFLLLRWFFRLFVWYRFLWQISRMPLHLNALHPDRAGGLGFLDTTPFAFALVLLAQMVSLGGNVADRVIHEGAVLARFMGEGVAILILSLLLVYLPLMFFGIRLYDARSAGKRDYGIFAAEYVRDFRKKWINKSPGETREPALGSGDIQSLADLGNSFNVITEMNLFPFLVRSMMRLTAILVVPLLPLLFLQFPVNEIIQRVFKMLL